MSNLSSSRIFITHRRNRTALIRECASQMPEQYFIGVDVGGTKVAAGLVNTAGEITHPTRVPMAPSDRLAGLAAVNSAIETVRAASDLDPRSRGLVAGIGICAPGPLDPRTGVVINPPNLPGWRNFPLA